MVSGMSDVYVEWLVKRTSTGLSKVIKFLSIFIMIIIVLLFVFTGNFFVMIVAIVVGVAAYMLKTGADVEYEYLYVDKQLSIDSIFSKTRRKKSETLDLERVEIIAPLDSVKLDNFKHKQVKSFDYSSRDYKNGGRKFVIYYNSNKKIIIEPNKDMIMAMRSVAPHKVHLD
ncbi:MAG: DUF6106 family protein [Lachnospiraceae bacterium]